MTTWGLFREIVGDCVCDTFVPLGGFAEAQLRRTDPNAVLVWTTEASSYNDANRKRYRHMGWGEFKPMLDENGAEYAEDNAPRPEGE